MTTSVKKGGREARGDITRQRVIDAAIEEFGSAGFEGTSTRTLAARARTNLTAIRYHFGGKEGLYLAAAEHIAAGIGERLRSGLDPVLRTATSAHATEDELIAAIGTLVDAMAAQVTGGVPDSWVTFVIREQLHPGPAFDVLFNTAGRFIEVLANLTGRVVRQPGDSEEARLLALMLFGQVAVFRSHRAAALRTLGWRDLGSAQQRQLRAAISRNVVIQLRALARAGSAGLSGRSADRAKAHAGRRRSR